MSDHDSKEILSKEAQAFVERKTRTGRAHPPSARREESGEIPMGSSAVSNGGTFAARCEPPDLRHSLIAAPGMSVFIGQCVRRNGRKQMWDSVIVRCEELTDGTLSVRVFVCDPSWEELLQIAQMSSRPSDPENHAVLGCNLDHISGPRTR